MKIINGHFEVGQRYVGMVDGTPFTVEKIQPAGRYENQYGGIYTVSETQVIFRDEKQGKRCIVGLKTAKHLLLRLVEV